MFHIESVPRKEIYSYVLRQHYFTERILGRDNRRGEKKRLENGLCAWKHLFFSFHLQQFNKHFALFVSFDCHDENTTNVIAQTAPMVHQPCESAQKGTKPDPSCLPGQLIMVPWDPDLGCRNSGSLLCLGTAFLHDLQFKTYRWEAAMLPAPDRVAARMNTSRATLFFINLVMAYMVNV